MEQSEQDLANYRLAVVYVGTAMKAYMAAGHPINALAKAMIGMSSQILAETLDPRLVADELRRVADAIEKQEGDFLLPN